VRGSGHSIQFMNWNYLGYRDRCLELWGIGYRDIEVYIDQRYHPLRLPRTEADQSGSSTASDPAGSQSPIRECIPNSPYPERHQGDGVQSAKQKSRRKPEGSEQGAKASSQQNRGRIIGTRLFSILKPKLRVSPEILSLSP
jgi:hypothetical protein